MSSSKKVDLLVRVRYANLLPPPPCPPKLLMVDTDLSRFASYKDSASIARGLPLPMMVDGECGMGLDLLDWPSAWEGDFGEMNPVGAAPTLHPADAELLMPPRPDLPPASLASSSKRPEGVSGTTTPALTASREPANNWLLNARGTAGELRANQRSDLGIDNSAVNKKKTKLAPTSRKRPEKVDDSKEAQLKLIEQTFDDLARTSVDQLKFPGKPQLKVVESFDILPDPSTWSNGYSLFRFQEPPESSSSARHVVDPRLSSALWRPTVNTDGDNVMVYYLAPEDKAEQAASALHAEPDYVPEPIPFEIVRKYELVGQERQGTELALVFRQGDEIQGEGADGQEGGSKKRKAGLAGYHEFHSRTTLRKKRALRNQHGEEDTEGVDQWDVVQFTLSAPSEEVAETRKDERGVVDDPGWGERALLDAQQRGEEGEEEEEAEAEVKGEEEDQEMEEADE